MTRYRMRFLLQEFDVPEPEVVIGRSPDCHITIEDPLVSRRHARINVAETPPRVYDLGSRNGVLVNGERISTMRALEDGDRIRIGTQELVFYVADRKSREVRSTGFMTLCAQCGTPFPEQAPQCPHCGAAKKEEDTISGLLVEPRRRWTFQLLSEVIERAIASGRSAEGARILRRATREVDERIGAGERLTEEELTSIAHFAVRLAPLDPSNDWIDWMLGVHLQQGLVPTAPVMDELEKQQPLAPAHRRLVVDFVSRSQHGAISRQPEGIRAPLLARLAKLSN